MIEREAESLAYAYDLADLKGCVLSSVLMFSGN